MTAELQFTKMQGLGNDYIYFNCINYAFEKPEIAARSLSDRHFGIGGDGIVLIESSKSADLRMRMFNADGSEAEMCGNAIRCVAKFAYERGLLREKFMRIETGSGIKGLDLEIIAGSVAKVRVNMGEPELRPEAIPVNAEGSQVVAAPISLDDRDFAFTAVSMGNPHAVIFASELSDELVLGLGPKVENNELFPKRINAEFVKVISSDELQMRVWERGSGETLACGTGACAAAVASSLNGFSGKSVTVHLLGGDLFIEWADDGQVFMTGPAEFVFDGTVPVTWLK